MKTLFLHIGTPKTATSSIQAFCVKNRQVFESKGYCYPYTVHSYPGVSDNRNAHFMIGKLTNSDGKRDYKEEERLFSIGMENLHECFQKYDNVVMSDENIWGMSNTTFKNLWSILKEDSAANNYTIKIVVYLRRQDTFLISRWNQLVKGGTSAETWSEHLLHAPSKIKMRLDYAASLNRIADFFGKENITVRRFNRDSFFGGTIYADFIRCLGLEITDGFEELQENENLSLKGNIVEIMRVMNTTPVINKEDHAYWQKMLAMCSKESDKYYKCSMFSKEEAEAFLERYREGNEKVAADFIGDGKPLFDYDVDDLPKWEKQNEYMLDDVIRVFTVLAYDSHQEIEKLKKQVAENRLSVENISRKGKNYIRRKLGLEGK